MSPLSHELLLQACTVPGLTFAVRDAVPSTNTLLRTWAEEGAPHGTVLAASSQTAGRGRRERAFFSPDGSGLYLSVLLRPDLPAGEALLLTTCAAVSVALALEELTGEAAQIKWVNDVFFRGRKVCGILTEGALDAATGKLRYAVVGVGVNVFPPAGGFPPELADLAGAVFPPERARPGLREALAGAILERFFSFLPDLRARPFFEDYRRRSLVLGRPVLVLERGNSRPAHAIDLTPDFSLLVREEDGTVTALSSGEVQVRPGGGGWGE